MKKTFSVIGVGSRALAGLALAGLLLSGSMQAVEINATNGAVVENAKYVLLSHKDSVSGIAHLRAGISLPSNGGSESIAYFDIDPVVSGTIDGGDAAGGSRIILGRHNLRLAHGTKIELHTAAANALKIQVSDDLITTNSPAFVNKVILEGDVSLSNTIQPQTNGPLVIDGEGNTLSLASDRSVFDSNGLTVTLRNMRLTGNGTKLPASNSSLWYAETEGGRVALDDVVVDEDYIPVKSGARVLSITNAPPSGYDIRNDFAGGARVDLNNSSLVLRNAGSLVGDIKWERVGEGSLTLRNDITFDGTVTWSFLTGGTLDLKGRTIFFASTPPGNFNGNINVDASTTLTIKNGTLHFNDNSNATASQTIQVQSTSKLHLQNVRLLGFNSVGAFGPGFSGGTVGTISVEGQGGF